MSGACYTQSGDPPGEPGPNPEQIPSAPTSSKSKSKRKRKAEAESSGQAMGRPPKETEEKFVNYRFGVPPSEMQQLELAREKHGFKNKRDFIMYLLTLDTAVVTGSSTPTHQSGSLVEHPPISPIRPSITSTPASSRRLAKRRVARSLSSGASSSTATTPASSTAASTPSALTPGSVTLSKRSKPIYAGAAGLFREKITITDADLVDHDPFEFEDDPDPEAPGPSYSFLQESVNKSDHFGQALESPPEDVHAVGWEEKLAAQKATEPEPLDHSDSIRLLPDGYYKEWSKNNIRIHRRVRDQPDKYGHLPSKVSRKKRLDEAPKMKPSLDIVKDGRYIVEFHQLLKLVSSKCYRAECNAINLVDEPELYREGGALRITIKCEKGHEFEWWSCRRLQHQTDNRCIYCSVNVLLPAAVAVTGNSWKKIEFMFNAMNVRIPSHSHYYRYQKYIVAPVVNECWLYEQKAMAKTLKENKLSVVTAGDGSHDSPGHTAMHCTYVQMIVATGKEDEDGKKKYEKTAYVFGLNVTDKRHTNLSSPKMEFAGFLRSMLEMAQFGLTVDEVATDAASSIKRIMILAKTNSTRFKIDAQDALKSFKHLPPNYLQFLSDICKTVLHQLDVWHKAKNIGKALMLGKVGRGGNRKNYAKWVRHIKNHWFWCCNNCEGNLNIFKDTWFGLLHHVQGKHEWATGSCRHEADYKQRNPESHPIEIDGSSEAFKSIQRVVTAKTLQQDMPYYLHFRHTGAVENWNSLSLSYALKRVALSYRIMIMKKQLAAMDNNDAVHRPAMRNEATAKPVVKAQWSRAAADWIAVVLKLAKMYSHIPHLMAKCLHQRSVTPYVFWKKQVFVDAAEDPTEIAKTIAKTQKSLPEVLEHRKSRFVRDMEVVQESDDDEDEEDAENDQQVDFEEVEYGSIISDESESEEDQDNEY